MQYLGIPNITKTIFVIRVLIKTRKSLNINNREVSQVIIAHSVKEIW